MALENLNQQLIVIMIISFVMVTGLMYLVFTNFSNPDMSLLKSANFYMSIIHLLIALFMYINHDDDGWIVFTEKEVFDDSEVEGDTIRDKLQEIQRRTFETEIKRTNVSSVFKLCALFSLLTAVAHYGLYSYSGYSGWINSGQNPMRWIEYSITSGIMMTCLASVSNIKNNYNVLSVFWFTSITNIFGMAIEATKLEEYKLAFMAFGFIPFIVPWYMITDKYTNFSTSINNFESLFDDEEDRTIELGNNEDGEPITISKEDFEENKESLSDISYLILGILVLYNLFPAIQTLQIFFPEKYRLGELSFIFASFISKISLNSGIYALGGRPNFTADYDEIKRRRNNDFSIAPESK